MANNKRVADFNSKQTEHCGNVQLRDFYTNDIVEIRKIFTSVFESLNYIEDYFFIVHDDSEYLHVHFILLLKVQVRCSTIVNQLSELLKVSPLAISDDKLLSIVLMLKYILHITPDSIEDGKKEYKAYEIMSNVSDFIINGYLESESNDNISTRLIRQLVIECDIKTDVLIKLGSYKLIRKNRYLIDTFWNDKGTLMIRQDKYNIDLPFDN